MNDPIPDALRAKVSQLPREIAPAHDLWPAIRNELDAAPDSGGSRRPARLLRFALPLSAAAALAVVAFLAWPRPAASGPAWSVATISGAPRVGDKPVDGAAAWRTGEWLETDAHSSARFDVGSIGEVRIEPGSRVRLVNTSESDHRLELARGSMSAFIWSPPRLFFVETPSATAIDLGCAYTLTVGDDGSGVLHVTSGYVALEHGDRESIVPAGMKCVTRRGAGPGTPFAEDAPEALRDALDRFDAAPADGDAALDAILPLAREPDAVTLWHLLSRASAARRGAVFDRLASIAPPPDGVTREGLVTGDSAMRDRWALEIGLVPNSP